MVSNSVKTVPAAQEAESSTSNADSQVSFILPKKGVRRRLEPVLVRVQPEDKIALQTLAREADLSLSAYCGLILHDVVKQASRQRIQEKAQNEE